MCGEWNDWSASADVMRRDAEGGFSLIVDLEAGRAYRFRYLLDDQRWENDWAADAYLPNSFGGDDSVVDLDRAGQSRPTSREEGIGEGCGTGREGTGDEGRADADREEGLRASSEASQEDDEVARARAGRCRRRCCGRDSSPQCSAGPSAQAHDAAARSGSGSQ